MILLYRQLFFYFLSPFAVSVSNMQCTSINNVGNDTVFSGCENDNDSKDGVVIDLYIHIFFTIILFTIMVIYRNIFYDSIGFYHQRLVVGLLIIVLAFIVSKLIVIQMFFCCT